MFVYRSLGVYVYGMCSCIFSTTFYRIICGSFARNVFTLLAAVPHDLMNVAKKLVESTDS